MNAGSILDKKLSKTKRKKLLTTLEFMLTDRQCEFILSKTHNLKLRRLSWTAEEKSFLLNIYNKSSKAYKLLTCYLNFPPITMLKLSTNVAQRVGFSQEVFKYLNILGRKLSNVDKLCILTFDKIAIKIGAMYSEELDRILGYECTSEEPDTDQLTLATHAIVFMARGIHNNWEQPIGFFYTQFSTPIQTLKKLLSEAITSLNAAGFKVVAVVCDQGTENQHLYKDLKVTPDRPYVDVGEEKIFALYDSGYLLKSVYHNLKSCNIHFNGKIASWEHIIKFFEADSFNERYRLAPNLTSDHLAVTDFENTDLKLAIQTLSYSVATGLDVYGRCYAKTGFPAAATETAIFVGEMDELFDSMHSRKSFSASKKWTSALSEKSCHLSGWHEKMSFIKSWSFEKEPDSFFTPPCKEGWLITISGVIQLWKSLKNNVPYLFTNRLSMDCLHEIFSSVRKQFTGDPNVIQFQIAIHEQMMNYTFKNFSAENCADKNVTDRRHISHGGFAASSSDDSEYEEPENLITYADFLNFFKL